PDYVSVSAERQTHVDPSIPWDVTLTVTVSERAVPTPRHSPELSKRAWLCVSRQLLLYGSRTRDSIDEPDRWRSTAGCDRQRPRCPGTLRADAGARPGGGARGRVVRGMGLAHIRRHGTRHTHNRPRAGCDSGVRLRGTPRCDGKPRSGTH